jgi:hypothetical protein
MSKDTALFSVKGFSKCNNPPFSFCILMILHYYFFQVQRKLWAMLEAKRKFAQHENLPTGYGTYNQFTTMFFFSEVGQKFILM